MLKSIALVNYSLERIKIYSCVQRHKVKDMTPWLLVVKEKVQ